MRRTVMLAALALATALAGCQKKAEAPPPVATTTPAPKPFQVTGIELGKTLTADRKIAAPTTSFGTKDTIYAVIASEGEAKSVTLGARWTYMDGKDVLLVAADSQMVAPTGPAWTEFHILKPTRWPAGTYALDVTADGKAAGHQNFNVK